MLIQRLLLRQHAIGDPGAEPPGSVAPRRGNESIAEAALRWAKAILVTRTGERVRSIGTINRFTDFVVHGAQIQAFPLAVLTNPHDARLAESGAADIFRPRSRTLRRIMPYIQIRRERVELDLNVAHEPFWRGRFSWAAGDRQCTRRRECRPDHP